MYLSSLIWTFLNTFLQSDSNSQNMFRNENSFRLNSKIPYSCGCYKEEERLHANLRVEEESAQSSDNGRIFFDDDWQQCTPFLPTCTPTLLGFQVSNFSYGSPGNQYVMTHVPNFECYSENEFVSKWMVMTHSRHW